VSLHIRKEANAYVTEFLGLEPVSFLIKNDRLRCLNVEHKDDVDWLKCCIVDCLITASEHTE